MTNPVQVHLGAILGGFPKLGVPSCGGPYIKEYGILESTWGSPSFVKLPLQQAETLGLPGKGHHGRPRLVLGALNGIPCCQKCN